MPLGIGTLHALDERWMDRGIERKGSEQQPANNVMGRKDGRG